MTYPDLDRKLSDYIKELFISYQGADSPITNHFPDELSARCEIYNTVLHHVDIKVQNGFAIYDIYPCLHLHHHLIQKRIVYSKNILNLIIKDETNLLSMQTI